MANKDLFAQAIADAKKLKEISLENAKQAIEEAFAPRIQEMFRLKLSELEEGDDETMEEYAEMQPDRDMDGDGDVDAADAAQMKEASADHVDEMTLDEILAELELEEGDDEMVDETLQEAKEDEKEEEAEEAEETEDEEITDLSIDEFKDLIRDVLADVLASQGGAAAEKEAGEEAAPEGDLEGGDDETIDLGEILAEMEEAEAHQQPVKESILAAGTAALFSTILSLYLAKKHDEKIALAQAKLEKGEDLTKDEMAYITKKVAADSATQVGKTMGGETTTETLQEDLVVAPALALASVLLAFYAGIKKDKAAAKKAAELEKGGKLSDAEAQALSKKVAASAAGAIGGKMTGEPVDENVTEELNEAVRTINALKAQLNEVNLLNAKLLYVNKLFKAKSLTETQKVKVVSAFDKATTLKEAKSIYEVLKDSFTTTVTKAPIKESLGFASKPIGNAPAKPIVEADSYVYRMQQLAGIRQPNI